MEAKTVQCITQEMIQDWCEQAKASPRLRVNYNVHRQTDDPIQRLFIAARRDSYFRPHRHPGKREFAIVLAGRFDVYTFDEVGQIDTRVESGPAAAVCALEIPANVWHAWMPLDDASVFFEVKPGPYDPQTAAEFAPWSPAEGSPDVAAFLRSLAAAKAGMRKESFRS